MCKYDALYPTKTCAQVKQLIIAGLRRAGAHPAYILLYELGGWFMTHESRATATEEERAAWDIAVASYLDAHPETEKYRDLNYDDLARADFIPGISPLPDGV